MEEEIKNLSNDQLLEDTIQLAVGDDWDGLFTRTGKKRFRLLRQELERRLKEIKFLIEDY